MMPSPTYELFRQAILGGRQIVCSYKGFRRELCPHILGRADGRETALTFQFAGDTSSRLPPGGGWRCLTLTEVRDAELRDGPWFAGAQHGREQHCVRDVDLDINVDVRHGRRA